MLQSSGVGLVGFGAELSNRNIKNNIQKSLHPTQVR
jgi:hypothetical protein